MLLGINASYAAKKKSCVHTEKAGSGYVLLAQ